MKNKTLKVFLFIFTLFLVRQNYIFYLRIEPCKTMLINELKPKSWLFFSAKNSHDLYLKNMPKTAFFCLYLKTGTSDNC